VNIREGLILDGARLCLRDEDSRLRGGKVRVT
jgi:hypothetical protein